MVVFEDNAPNVAATMIVLSTISLIVFPLRVYTRLKHEAWGRDDWCMSVAVIPYTALSIFCLGSSFLGVGVHKESLDEQHTQTAMKWFFFFEVFFCLAIIPVKLSIAFMLMRIAGPKKIYHQALWTMSTLFVLMNLISFFYIIFRCRPISFAWDTSTPDGHCLPSHDLADIYYADTAINIITDWCCALLPIPLLWNLKLNTNSKISVAFLLSLGVLASLSACIRLKYTVNLNNTDDYLFSVGDVMIWGYAENGVGFIVGCCSTLRPLFRRRFHLGSSENHLVGGLRCGKGEASRREQYGDPYYLGDEGHQCKMQTAVTSSKMGGRKNSEEDIESVSGESEEYILRELKAGDGKGENKLEKGDMGGIQVSRSVHQRRD